MSDDKERYNNTRGGSRFASPPPEEDYEDGDSYDGSGYDEDSFSEQPHRRYSPDDRGDCDDDYSKHRHREEGHHGHRKKNTFADSFIPNADDSAGVKARKIAVIAVIVILLLAAAYFIISLGRADGGTEQGIESGSGEELVTSVITSQTTVTTTVPTETEPPETTTTPPPPLVMREEITPTYNENNDTVGWLKIGGTAVNTSVVQGTDNDFYLNHDFYGNPRMAGYVYADYRCVISDYDFNQSDNITVYGHNQADGSMFGTLQYYKIKKSDTSRFSFYQEHPTFNFSNLYEDYTYKIVAMFVSEAGAYQSRDGEIFDVHNFVKFSSDKSDKRSFDNFVKQINERSEVLTGVDMQEGDKFMTLSTCSNEFDNSRFIVIGRRVREGESEEVDTSKAVLNPDVIEPDLNFIYYGS